MAKEPMKKTSSNVSTQPPQNTEEEIRHRAYEIYETRGREDGHDLDDWLRAEAEVKRADAKTAAA